MAEPFQRAATKPARIRRDDPKGCASFGQVLRRSSLAKRCFCRSSLLAPGQNTSPRHYRFPPLQATKTWFALLLVARDVGIVLGQRSGERMVTVTLIDVKQVIRLLRVESREERGTPRVCDRRRRQPEVQVRVIRRVAGEVRASDHVLRVSKSVLD